MEILGGVLGELVEEELEQGVDVGAGRQRVGDVLAAVGEADSDGLVEEDDGGIGVPRVVVALNGLVGTNASRAEVLKEAEEGRASGAAAEPEDDGIRGRIIARLEEPWSISC